MQYETVNTNSIDVSKGDIIIIVLYIYNTYEMRCDIATLNYYFWTSIKTSAPVKVKISLVACFYVPIPFPNNNTKVSIITYSLFVVVGDVVRN